MKKTEKLKVPTCQTLLKPPTIAGISREIFVLNFASTLSFIVIFESVLMIIFGLILHDKVSEEYKLSLFAFVLALAHSLAT